MSARVTPAWAQAPAPTTAPAKPGVSPNPSPPVGADASGPGSSPEAAGGAKSDPRREQAKLQYSQGVEAYRQGRYQAAVDHLLEASKLIPSPALSYNIAVAYAAMQDERAALRWFRNYLREAPQAPDAGSVSRRVEQLERALQAKGVQQVTFLSQPSGATLVLDERPVGVTPFTLEVPPGNHRVRVSLTGYASEELIFEVRPDRARDVHIELKADSAELLVPPAAPERRAPKPAATSVELLPLRPVPPAVSAAPSRPGRWLGVIGLGVGGAALGASVVFEMMRRSAEDDVRTASQLHYQDRYDVMESRKVTARVFAVAGSALLVGGAAALILDWRAAKSRRAVGVAACGMGSFCPVAQGEF